MQKMERKQQQQQQNDAEHVGKCVAIECFI